MTLLGHEVCALKVLTDTAKPPCINPVPVYTFSPASIRVGAQY